MLSYFADFFLDNGTVHYGYLYDFHILIFYAYLNVCEQISSKITWTSKWLFYYFFMAILSSNVYYSNFDATTTAPDADDASHSNY